MEILRGEFKIKYLISPCQKYTIKYLTLVLEMKKSPKKKKKKEKKKKKLLKRQTKL